jgi:hypothetical protein
MFGIDDAVLLALAAASLFGGKKDSTQQTTTTPAYTPSDPMYNVLSPYLASMLTQNFQRLSGAGYPGGIGIGGNMSNDLIDMIGNAWPDIMKNAGTPKQDTTGWSKVSVADCAKGCSAKGIRYGNPDYEKCIKDCMSTGMAANKAKDAASV